MAVSGIEDKKLYADSMYKFIFRSESADGLPRDRNISQALSTDADFAEAGLDVLLQATAR